MLNFTPLRLILLEHENNIRCLIWIVEYVLPKQALIWIVEKYFIDAKLRETISTHIYYPHNIIIKFISFTTKGKYYILS